VKIFEGFEEIEIVPWFECQDCAKHLRFTDELFALLFLQRFRAHDLALDSLRRWVRERGPGLSPAVFRDEDMLEQAAKMLATRELHVTRKPLVFEMGKVGPPKERSQPQPALQSPAPRAAEPPPPPPDDPVFLPDIDPVAIAQVLTHASLSGVPFCAE